MTFEAATGDMTTTTTDDGLGKLWKLSRISASESSRRMRMAEKWKWHGSEEEKRVLWLENLWNWKILIFISWLNSALSQHTQLARANKHFDSFQVWIPLWLINHKFQLAAARERNREKFSASLAELLSNGIIIFTRKFQEIFSLSQSSWSS